MQKLEQQTDIQLQKELTAGNHKAFTELYHRHKHSLFQFIIRLSHGDYLMAEEIVQQSFMLMWENRERINIEQSFLNYLKTMARNLFLKETFQRINKELIISRMEFKEDVGTGVEEEVEMNMLLEEIERVVSLLPPARQHVYRLKHMEHFSQKEIAEKLGISENTVESHLRQSSRFLRLMLKANWGDTIHLLLILLYPIRLFFMLNSHF